MKRIAAALALAFLVALPASSTDKTDVVATIHQFVDGFNKGDTKSALATCAQEATIIDEFPPYGWHGAGACDKWAADYDADARKNGVTDGVVTLGTPRHVDVTGDHAYVVAPVEYSFNQNGKPVKEINSTFTVVLHKEAAGWRIVSWAWSKH